MHVAKKTLAISAAVATAVALGPVMVGQGVAFAAPAAPSLSINPSTGLHDGQSITATVSGFGGSEDLFLVECAMPKRGQFACDLQDAGQIKTDAKGNGTAKVTVHKTYQSSTPDGKAGPKIDCAKIQGGCVLGAGNPKNNKELAGASLKFG